MVESFSPTKIDDRKLRIDKEVDHLHEVATMGAEIMMAVLDYPVDEPLEVRLQNLEHYLTESQLGPSAIEKGVQALGRLLHRDRLIDNTISDPHMPENDMCLALLGFTPNSTPEVTRFPGGICFMFTDRVDFGTAFVGARISKSEAKYQEVKNIANSRIIGARLTDAQSTVRGVGEGIIICDATTREAQATFEHERRHAMHSLFRIELEDEYTYQEMPVPSQCDTPQEYERQMRAFLKKEVIAKEARYLDEILAILTEPASVGDAFLRVTKRNGLYDYFMATPAIQKTVDSLPVDEQKLCEDLINKHYYDNVTDDIRNALNCYHLLVNDTELLSDQEFIGLFQWVPLRYWYKVSRRLFSNNNKNDEPTSFISDETDEYMSLAQQYLGIGHPFIQGLSLGIDSETQTEVNTESWLPDQVAIEVTKLEPPNYEVLSSIETAFEEAMRD